VSARPPVVAVVGRPNVGKSTLFNRVIGRRVAIVDARPGVTRDRNFARADWAGREFLIVDTGGITEGSDLSIDRSIRTQAMAAIEEADVILFVVDGKEGVHPFDEMIAEARKHIDNHSPEEAKRRVDDDGALLIDVRDIRELQRDGVIPGAMHVPRGMLEFWVSPDSTYFKPVFAEDIEFVLY